MSLPSTEATIQILAQLAEEDAKIRDVNFEKHMDMYAITEHTLKRLRAKTGEPLKEGTGENDNE